MKIAVKANVRINRFVLGLLRNGFSIQFSDRDFLPARSFAYGGTNKSPLEVRGELISRSIVQQIRRFTVPGQWNMNLIYSVVKVEFHWYRDLYLQFER